jgi:hypothetical protein
MAKIDHVWEYGMIKSSSLSHNSSQAFCCDEVHVLVELLEAGKLSEDDVLPLSLGSLTGH